MTDKTKYRPAYRLGQGARAGAAGGMLVLALSGCEALHPAPTVDRAALMAEAQSSPVATSGWWRVMNDPVLNDLESRALAQNLDVKLALERVLQRREAALAAGAALLPQVGVKGAETRSALSADGPMVALGAPSAPTSLWEASVGLQWEADLWGRARNLRAASQDSADAAAADLNGAQLALTAEVARTYVQLRAAQEMVAIIRGNQDVSNRSVRIAESRFDNGVSGSNDTASAMAQQASVAALLPVAEARRDRLMNAMAALLALPPHALDATLGAKRPIPVVGRIPAAVPSDLAKGRPDIAAAAAALQAAIHDREAAKANFYPSVSITGTFGKQGWDASDLGDWGSRMWAIGPAFSLPIFTGGRITAQYEVAKSQEQAAAITWRKTVLGAWQQIDDALSEARAERARAGHLGEAATRYAEALTTAEHAYEEGTTEYLPQLVAQRDLLSAQQALTEAQMSATLAAIDLYRAVGTGWLSAGAAK